MTLMTDSELAGKSIVKSTLVRRIAEKCKEASPKDIEAAINHILDSMNHTLIAGGRIEIRGFGAFSLRYRPPRKAHNPKTGEKVSTGGKYVLYFRSGKDVKGRINIDDEPIRETEIQEMEEEFA